MNQFNQRDYNPYNVMRSQPRVRQAAEGGEIQQDDYLSVNEEYVKQMPDAFMRDPSKAKTAEEVAAIYAHNRRVKSIASGPQEMNTGGQALGGGPQQVVGEAGPIGANPEQVTEAQSVADDIPKEVPEGTLIITQPAAELMGTRDVKEMLLGAVKELRAQGINFSFGKGKVPEGDAVSLLVSKGEIQIHPLLAKIIGTDRLNKINNRGLAEVKKRVEENGQSPEAEALGQPPSSPPAGIPMSEGGFTGFVDEIMGTVASKLSKINLMVSVILEGQWPSTINTQKVYLEVFCG